MNTHGTNPNDPHTDNDGPSDGNEVNNDGTGPIKSDDEGGILT
ncbi:hypothetical protein [Haloferax sp. DFSO52]